MTMAKVDGGQVVAVGLPNTLHGRSSQDIYDMGWRVVTGGARPPDPGDGTTYVYRGPYTYNAEEDVVYGKWSLVDLRAEVLAQERSQMRVTRRQAKQQLSVAGLLGSIQGAIDAIPDPHHRELVQIYWDDSLHLERLHPELIALGTGLGLDDEQMDDLFREASLR